MKSISGYFVILLAACVLQASAKATVLAQSVAPYKAGDRVEADVNMASSPENAKWRKATITKVEMWQGQVSGYFIRTDDGGEHVVAARHLRRLAEAEKGPAESVPPAKGAAGRAGGDAQFKVGDRVEVDSIMAREPADSKWKKATVKAVDLENRRYVVVLDDNGLDMSVLIRPGKVWIRPLKDGSRAPQAPDCPFVEPPGKVTKTAAASAALFKRVIFAWRDSLKRGSRIGITFEVFEMGTAYRNVLTAKGRLLDFVPTNATVYPVKTRQLTCEQFPTQINRVVVEIVYACYRNEFGDWVCRNGAPKELERTSIYRK